VIWNRLYLIYGIATVLLLGAGAYRGWSFTSVSEVKDLPMSIRDNPGSYRSIYSSYHHYTGGK
jgi:hypothetical protein